MHRHPLLLLAVILLASSLATQTAQFTTAGIGCPSASPPGLTLAGQPVLGTTPILSVSGLPADAFLPTVALGGGTTDMPLWPLGASGCSGLINNMFVTFGMSMSAPNATVPIAIPSQPAFLGTSFHTQALAISPSSNSLALSLSDRGSFTIGTSPNAIILPYGGAVLDDVSGLTPVITISRTAGSIPCVVQATAAASTATWFNPSTLVTEPLPHPYDQLHYTWDFGDGAGLETMTHPVSGSLLDADRHQTGPQATFIYRRQGTYTITLTASIKNRAGLITQASTTVTVNVSDFSGQTRYFDPAGGSDANDGLSSATPLQSWNAFSSWVTGGDNRRALLKRGTTMVQTQELSNDRSHTRVEPYGLGADPIIQAAPTFPATAMLTVQASHYLEDQVYSGINLIGMGRADTVVYAFGQDDPAARDVVFMNCTFENSLPNGMTLVTLTGDHLSRFAFWDCHFRHNDAPGHGLYSHLNGDNAPQEFLSVVGGSFLGGDGRPLLDHHIYDSGWRRYDLLRWIDFGPATSKNFCINMNCTHNGNDTEFILIDGCDVTGCSNGIDASNGLNDPSLGQFNHFIIQNTAVHDGKAATGYGLFGYSVSRYVVRDSFFYGNPRSDFRIDDPGVSFQVYRNKFWRNTDGNTTTGVRLMPGQSGMFADNIFVVDSNPGNSQRILSIPAAESASYTFTGNHYWSPHLISAGQVSPFYDSSTSDRLTVGDWFVLFPTDGTYGDPGFINPAMGVF